MDYATDRIVTFPFGTAHFIEHLLFGPEIREIAGLNRIRSLAKFNAFVDESETVWTADIWTDELDPSEPVLSVLTSFIEMLTVDLRRVDFCRQLMETSKRDVINEIAYRNGERSYVVRQKVLSLLFGNHPLGLDMLGTEKSLYEIDENHVLEALKILRESLNSITLIGNSFSARSIRKLVSGINWALSSLKGIEGEITPIISQKSKGKDYFQCDGVPDSQLKDIALAALGIRLKPFDCYERSCSEAVIRQYVMNNALAGIVDRSITGIIAPAGRVFFCNCFTRDHFFFVDHEKCNEITRNLLDHIVRSLVRFRKKGREGIFDLISRMIDQGSGQIADVCRIMDRVGYSTCDFFDILLRLEEGDFSLFEHELRALDNKLALVFASKYADLI